MGKPGTPMQDRAVIKEFEEALDTGNYILADRIREANPDLALPLFRALMDRYAACVVRGQQ